MQIRHFQVVGFGVTLERFQIPTHDALPMIANVKKSLIAMDDKEKFKIFDNAKIFLFRPLDLIDYFGLFIFPLKKITNSNTKIISIAPHLIFI